MLHDLLKMHHVRMKSIKGQWVVGKIYKYSRRQFMLGSPEEISSIDRSKIITQKQQLMFCVQIAYGMVSLLRMFCKLKYVYNKKNQLNFA